MGTPHTTARHRREPARRGRPNFVVIVADDLGYGELGAYGQTKIQTPNLDRLATEGTRFTDFYSGSPICAPSRCAMLTGLHTGHSSVRANPGGDPVRASLSRRDVTFGEVLQAVGYRTAYLGKWGFGPERPDQPSHPNARGFAEFFGYITHRHAHRYWPTYLWENDTVVRYPENALGSRVLAGKGTYAPDLFIDRAARFLERNRDHPFLLVLSLNLPHAPHQVPDVGPYRGRPWSYGNKAHAAQITRLDSYVGRVVEKLRELGLDENTLVFFAGDNGPHEEGNRGYDPRSFAGSGRLRGLKRNLYEGGIRVPMIAWSPGIMPTPTGRVSDHVWSLWDLYPTLADFADAPTPPDLDGLSARRALLGESPGASDRHLYWCRPGGTRFPLADRADRGRSLALAEAARQDHWKAVRFAPGRDRYVDDEEWTVELYDLREDPGETTDVAAEHPDITRTMVRLMRSSWEEPPFRSDTWSPEGLSINPPEFLVAGKAGRVGTVFTNNGRGTRRRVRLDLTVPDGWTAEPLSSTTFREVEPGHSVRTVWRVVPPADAAPDKGERRLRAEVSYRHGSSRERHRLVAPATVAPPAPAKNSHLSDLPWISATNGWGPVERDRMNARRRSGDGSRISLRGRAYRKGLGVHAPSRVTYYLGGKGSRLTATVGIDDFSAAHSTLGSVNFHVLADGRQLYDSGPLTVATGTRKISVDVSGADVLELVVAPAGDNTGFNQAAWADAFLTVRRRR
ncbi:MAG: sulfatase-like hydrolase/transferase [Streptosporangiales bacterium]|nr:sulfatase-like hydrolase/transferase [Streptosporangiales bacterium]